MLRVLPTGASAWAKLYPASCNLTDRQSPIALEYASAKYSQSLAASTANFSGPTASEENVDVNDDGVKCMYSFENCSPAHAVDQSFICCAQIVKILELPIIAKKTNRKSSDSRYIICKRVVKLSDI